MDQAFAITGTRVRRVARFALLVRSSMLDVEMHQSRNWVDANRKRDPKSQTEDSSDGEESEEVGGEPAKPRASTTGSEETHHPWH
jgi:hypothetical protein